MAWLIIESPDGERRGVELGALPILLGRSEDMDVRLPDPKVSGRHLRIRPIGDGETWIARDLGSTRGTRKNGKRVLRVGIGVGDELLLGATRVVLSKDPPPEAAPVVVGGTLDLKPAAPAPAPPPPPEPVALPPRAPAPRVRIRGLRLAFVWLALGVVALGGVYLGLGARAREAGEEARVRRDLRQVLGTSDLGTETFEAEVDDFLAKHPDLPEGDQLRELLASYRAREAERVAFQHRLLGLTEDLYGLPDSEVRGELIQLAATMPDDSDLARQVNAALTALDRRYAVDEETALDVLAAAVDRRTAAGDPAGALRRLTAFRRAWPEPRPTTLRRLQGIEDTTLAALDALAKHAEEEADATADPSEARRILARAWRGLEGTPQADRIAELLRFTRGTGRKPGTVEEPILPPEETEPKLLVDAAKAEDLAGARKWHEALAAFSTLVDKAEPGLLRTEWETRVREMAFVLSLVTDLSQRAADGPGVTVKLSGGAARIAKADDEGVVLAKGDDERRIAWEDVPDDDLLRILTPPKPETQERLGLAVLAASVSDRKTFVDVLVPLFQSGESTKEAGGLVARYLYGRSSPPPGGYHVHGGKILDAPTYERLLAEEKAAKLEEKALGILARIEKVPTLKKLEKMKALRAKLDERRMSALLAIFDEKHYPYPANKASREYQAVQKEIDRRVALVREVWDDPFKFDLAREGRLGRVFDEWDEVVGEIRALKVDTSELAKRIAPIAAYVGQGPTTIRTFWLNDAEKRLFAYNDWVMQTYNPARTAEATATERDQTRVTNEYRRMMGYMVAVKPGPASYEAITDDTAARVLDEGRIQGSPVPLYAVRIDDRLVRSARGHSLDMQARGYFSHFAPPNPRTGEPGTSPFDRIQAAGYTGLGMSENIAAGASSPEQAHEMWVHSSGHHRNILSLWTDQGVGQAGRLWTQNYGTGGGDKPVIPGETPAAAGGADHHR